MGLGTPIMMLIVCLSFVLYLYNPVLSPFAGMADILTGSGGSNTTLTGEMNNTGSQFATSYTASTAGFPNQFTLFGKAFGALFNFATYPLSIWGMTGLPVTIRLFLSVVFGVLYALAIITWFKGGFEP